MRPNFRPAASNCGFLLSRAVVHCDNKMPQNRSDYLKQLVYVGRDCEFMWPDESAVALILFEKMDQ